MKSDLRNDVDDVSFIEQLSVYLVVPLVTSPNEKYKKGAKGEYDDEAFLAHFIGQGIFCNFEDGMESFRHSSVNPLRG